jgi:hypothetical protein
MTNAKVININEIVATCELKKYGYERIGNYGNDMLFGKEDSLDKYFGNYQDIKHKYIKLHTAIIYKLK